jgi:hypothetical protein
VKRHHIAVSALALSATICLLGVGAGQASAATPHIAKAAVAATSGDIWFGSPNFCTKSKSVGTGIIGVTTVVYGGEKKKSAGVYIHTIYESIIPYVEPGINTQAFWTTVTCSS